jgi:hypothetical protein
MAMAKAAKTTNDPSALFIVGKRLPTAPSSARAA